MSDTNGCSGTHGPASFQTAKPSAQLQTCIITGGVEVVMKLNDYDDNNDDDE